MRRGASRIQIDGHRRNVLRAAGNPHFGGVANYEWRELNTTAEINAISNCAREMGTIEIIFGGLTPTHGVILNRAAHRLPGHRNFEISPDRRC